MLIKTTVYLDQVDYRRLQAIARRRKRCAADLIREAVTNYVLQLGGRRHPRSVGAGNSGRGDLSERAESMFEGARSDADRHRQRK